MRNSTLRLSSFTLGEKCGEGYGGVVWRATRKSDALACAVKILRSSLDDILDKDGILTEASIMDELRNPGHLNIAKYYGWGTISKEEMKGNKQEKYCCFSDDVGAFIVMELVDGVTLEEKLQDMSFGKNKRKKIYKQLLEVIIYMHTKRISHGGVYLNNIMVSVPTNSTNSLPRLVLCDFGASTVVPEDPVAVKIADNRLDRDRCQCGGVLFALFSSANLDTQQITNKLMQKEALRLARDLIDVRKPETLETALFHSFFTKSENEMCEFRFSSYNLSSSWNDEIVESIATHLIQTGDTRDFINASLVCKQFYVALQRRFLCTPQPFQHLVVPQNYAIKDIQEDADVTEISMWLQRVTTTSFSTTITGTSSNGSTGYSNNNNNNNNNHGNNNGSGRGISRSSGGEQWSPSHLHEYSDHDHLFELEIIDNCVESVLVHLVEIQSAVWNMTYDNQQWSNIYCRFHDIKGPSSYTGIWNMRMIAWLARDRSRFLSGNLSEAQFHVEKLLFIRTVALMKDILCDFNKRAKEYLHQHGLELPVRLWY